MDSLERLNFKFFFIFWIFVIILAFVLTLYGLFNKFSFVIIMGDAIFFIAMLFLLPVIYSIIKSKKCVHEYIADVRKLDFFTEPYHSIIIANSTSRWKKIGIFTGIDLLVEKIKTQNCKFKITLCNAPNEAKSEIENKNAKFIYLFGHGFKGGLTFYHKDSILTLNYNTINPNFCKKFIGQFHCNGGNALSLIELFSKSNCTEDNHYFQEGLTTIFILWYDIRFKVLKMIKKC